MYVYFVTAWTLLGLSSAKGRRPGALPAEEGDVRGIGLESVEDAPQSSLWAGSRATFGLEDRKDQLNHKFGAICHILVVLVEVSQYWAAA